MALPADLPEKARQFVEVQEGKDQEAQDSEDDGEYWEDQEEDVGTAELSESEALAEEYIAITGINRQGRCCVEARPEVRGLGNRR